MVRISGKSPQLNPATLKPHALNNKKNNPVAQVSQVLNVREIEQVQAPKKLSGNITNLTKNFGRRSVIAIATVLALAILVPIAMNSVQPKPEPQFDYKQADKFFSDILKNPLEKNKQNFRETSTYFPKGDELQDEGTIDLDRVLDRVIVFDYTEAQKNYAEILWENTRQQQDTTTYYPRDNRLVYEELQGKDLDDKLQYLQQQIPSETELQNNEPQNDEIVDVHSMPDCSYLETCSYFRMDTISFNLPKAISIYTDSSKKLVVKFLEDKTRKPFSSTTKFAYKIQNHQFSLKSSPLKNSSITNGTC
jgi:hypothetical protein